jgi:hypothetical protein
LYVRVFIIRGTGWDVSLLSRLCMFFFAFYALSPLSPPLLPSIVSRSLCSRVLIAFSGCLHAIDNGHELGR